MHAYTHEPTRTLLAAGSCVYPAHCCPAATTLRCMAIPIGGHTSPGSKPKSGTILQYLARRRSASTSSVPRSHANHYDNSLSTQITPNAAEPPTRRRSTNPSRRRSYSDSTPPEPEHQHQQHQQAQAPTQLPTLARANRRQRPATTSSLSRWVLAIHPSKPVSSVCLSLFSLNVFESLFRACVFGVFSHTVGECFLFFSPSFYADEIGASPRPKPSRRKT